MQIFIEDSEGNSLVEEPQLAVKSDFSLAVENGYLVLNPRVLHAADYNVPQSFMGSALRVGLSTTNPRSFLAGGFPLLSHTDFKRYNLNWAIMNIKAIQEALQSAYSLLNNEIDTIEYDELKNDYLSVIEKLEIALKEISRDE